MSTDVLAAVEMQEPHVWTHPADDCDVEGCIHRTVRTCEQAEHEKKFLRRIIAGLRKRLYAADPDAARTDWNRLMRAVEMQEMMREQSARELAHAALDETIDGIGIVGCDRKHARIAIEAYLYDALIKAAREAERVRETNSGNRGEIPTE